MKGARRRFENFFRAFLDVITSSAALISVIINYDESHYVILPRHAPLPPRKRRVSGILYVNRIRK